MGKGKRLRAQRAAAHASVMAEPSFVSDDPAVFDHELKLRRSYAHLQDVERKTRLYVEAAQNTFAMEPHPEMPGHVRGWVTANKPPRDPFSLLTGDCLQNLRTALDHLAFELNTGPTSVSVKDIAKRSEFPIFGNEDGKGSDRFIQTHTKGPRVGLPVPRSGLAKTEGMDKAALQIIEGLQPYNRGQAYDTHPLWCIHELHRIDKHRVLHAVAGFSEGPALKVTPTSAPAFSKALAEGGFRGILDVAHGDIDGRTYVGAWPAGSTPEGKQTSAAWSPRIQLTFEESLPLVGGQPILETLSDLYNYVVTDVLPPLIGFLK
jgi:hypothetical protein